MRTPSDRDIERHSGRKPRTPVPGSTSAEVLFLSDHTCCICRNAGRAVQIHHIDSDPTNHKINNLALLCTEDHDRTLLSGGFGRHLGAAEVERYRDDWLQRVADRRNKADELTATAMARVRIEISGPHPELILPSVLFIQSLPTIKGNAMRRCRTRWFGSHAETAEANDEYVQVLQSLLSALAAYLPAGYFGERSTQEFFAQFVFLRRTWHHAILRPYALDSLEPVIPCAVGNTIIGELDDMIKELVGAIYMHESPAGFNVVDWQAAWDDPESGA